MNATTIDSDSSAAPESNGPFLPFAELPPGSHSRRDFVRRGAACMAMGFFAERLAADTPAPTGNKDLPFHFKGVPISTEDTVMVPEGYVAEVVFGWGDPINGQGPAFLRGAANTAEEQALQAGMGHDGMQWFPWPGDDEARSDRGLLVMNHEYTDQGLLFPDGLEPMTKEKVAKCQAAHGVSVVAMAFQDGSWKVVPSPWSRRITATTPMKLTGPAAGSRHLISPTDPDGDTALGTFNNCASGMTPWGTYLACEENFHNYFGTEAPDFAPTMEQRRYGLSAPGGQSEEEPKRSLYQWWKHDERFDLAKHPGEAYRCGYVVEIDPTDPVATPRKHTALGRFKHENAAVTLSQDQRVVIYLGDDEKNEYIYKFVSKDRFDPSNRNGNLKLLENGTLHVARFLPGGRGEWIPLIQGGHGLTQENGFAKQEDIAVHTRQAADRVGATMMDRPEWISVHPHSKEVYVTLTNNSLRGKPEPSVNPIDGSATAGKSQPPVDAANPRKNNVYGHILKWAEDGGDAAAAAFIWDRFLLAGDPGLDSPETTEKVDIIGDPFGSPDGLTFDPRGILWIQTDVSTKTLNKKEYANLGNNMMLAADPVTKTVRRFLTGPKGCEITGLTFTPDLKTMFVNIQHPGEPSTDVSDHTQPTAVSRWPDMAAGDRPRPATVAISRKDGGLIGM